ncbi:MAG: PLDc N-terminal domain-containing protein [Chryseolinea sp.]
MKLMYIEGYYFLLLFHMLVALVAVIDLLVNSRRPNKFVWVIVIFLIPVAGVVWYQVSKRRP